MNDEFHDTSEASFLGTTIPANTSGEQALQLALDAIANHPNVGPFLGTQLIKRLVTSNPSPAYVECVANTFNSDETGARGNLSAVLKAVLLDPEAQLSSPVSDDRKGRLREPLMRFIQWGRTFGLNDSADKWIIYSTSSAQSQLGQSPLRAPSVFNFFRPEYVPPNSNLGDLGLTAPELQITNETSVAGYANFMHRKIPTGFSGTIRPDYSAELAFADNPQRLADRLNLLLAANQLSAETVNLIVESISSMPSGNSYQLLSRVHAAILMTMVSPDYLVLR